MRSGWVRRGMAEQGMDFETTYGRAWRVRARLGRARQGLAWHGKDFKTPFGMACWGTAGRGVAGRGVAGHDRDLEDTHTPYARQRVIRANGDRWGSRKSAANDLLCGFFFGGLLQC